MTEYICQHVKGEETIPEGCVGCRHSEPHQHRGRSCAELICRLIGRRPVGCDIIEKPRVNVEEGVREWPPWDPNLSPNLDLPQNELLGVANDNYATLQDELQEAFEQSASGKGKERHATGEPFEAQKICVIGRWVAGSPAAGCLQQVIKKTAEAARLPAEAAIHELNGATVYLQAAKILLREAE